MAVAAPFGFSLLFDGWMRDYVPPPHWQVDAMPSLEGKVAIVTGPTIGGIGYETGLEMAKQGAKVILAGRSLSKGNLAVSSIRAAVPAAKVEFMELDLGSMKSVAAFTDAYKSKGLPLHMLVLNAGIMANPFELTTDGLESQFGTNHIGHFLLTLRLLDVLKQSEPSRIVSVSSAASFMPEMLGLNMTDVYADGESRYGRFWSYGRSKLANVLFATELSKRLGSSSKVYVNSCHPGGIKTNLGIHLKALIAGEYGHFAFQMFEQLFHPVMMPTAMGAVTQLYLAASPEIEQKDIRGRYFHPQAREIVPSVLQTEENQRQLWEQSIEITKAYLPKDLTL